MLLQSVDSIAQHPMRVDSLLKEIADTHRNGSEGAQIDVGGSPSNTNRGVQPTCSAVRFALSVATCAQLCAGLLGNGA